MIVGVYHAGGTAVLMLDINGQQRSVHGSADTPLLWVLRDALQLKGTKYGCGIGMCGICTVLADGEPRRACVTPVAEVAGKQIVTIEGLASDPGNRVRRAWIAEQASQCGYCQPGQIMSAAALLACNPAPTDAEIDAAMSDVLCRCGTYQRIRRAIHRAAQPSSEEAGPLAVEASVPAVGSAVQAPAPAVTLNPWIRVAKDGTILMVIDRSEMGQGASTGLAMLVAEELALDLSQLRLAFAPAERAYFNPLLGEQVTGGSTSVRGGWTLLRAAAAAARERLIAAAAADWRVAKKECHAARGMVIHGPSGRCASYAELAERAATLPEPRRIQCKKPDSFCIIGTPQQRLDLPAHVSGRAVFGSDIVIPGMRVAVVKRCPLFGGVPASVNAHRARAVEGVREIVELETGVAVVADETWAALRGREALEVTWKQGPSAAPDSTDIKRLFEQAATRRGRLARDDGDAPRALARAADVIEAVYETPYLAHATMEPMNCTARVGPDGCDVWVPTQAQTETQKAAAQAAGLRRDQVRVHTTFLGGGFGRRLQTDFVTEAVRIAKTVGEPVQVFWTREDDMRHDYYRPASYTRLRAGLNRRGKPVAWFQRIVGPALALNGVDFPYAIPHVREEHVEVDPGIPTGPWRSVGASQNAFVIESFIDELAHAAAADPVEFRLSLLPKAARHRAVLELAAEKSGWGMPTPEGRYRGVALYRAFESYVAQVAEVSVSRDGEIRVHRVVCAIDCGVAVNPQLIAAQMEGGIVFGLSAALYGEITFAGGQTVQGSFRDYPIISMAEAPEVEVHIRSGRRVPGGVGEPGVPPIAPAVANAVFAATRQRLRRLPLRLGIQSV